MLTDPLYEYLTQPEQFDLMVEVVANASTVRLRLLTEFWDMTESRIQSELQPEGWYFVESPNRFDTWGGFYLAQDKDFTGISIGIESIATNFYYGLTFNAEKTKHLDRAAIEQYLAAQRLNEKFKKSVPWLMYRYYGINFTNLAACRNLLPAHREAYAAQVSTDLINFCRQMGPHLPVINKMAVAGR